MAGNMVRRLFTPEEANQRLPLVQVIVQDIVDLYQDVQSRQARIESVKRRRGESRPSRLYSEELDQMEEELQRDQERLAAFVRELHELGIEFKDPVLGLVDFPSEMDGRVVYLCWKLGEPEVKFWHEIQAGFASRQALFVELTVGDDLLGDELQAD
jgi:hypothetical protein